MESYETYFVREIVAAGDLIAVKDLVQALFAELGAKIPSVRNPRRLGWFRLWRERLSQAGGLPSPPGGHGTTPAHQGEAEQCAKRLIASGDSGAVETVLHTLAVELNSTAAKEANRARQGWMYQAGDILSWTLVDAGPPVLPVYCPLEEPASGPVRQHRGWRALAILFLCLLGLLVLTSLIAPLPLTPEM
jgi:hypothetical protein